MSLPLSHMYNENAMWQTNLKIDAHERDANA